MKIQSMRRWSLLPMLAVLMFFGQSCSTGLFAPAATPTSTPIPTETSTPGPSPTPVPNWKLVWQDEFDGPEIDKTKWTYDLGASGWGNNELEDYTNRPENARIEDGHLVIEARKESYMGSDYTSARLKTQGLAEWTYARVEARIRIPRGQGLWPAFWMLGNDIGTAGWPDCGEIDIMENIGREPDTVHGTLHGPGYSGASGPTSPFKLETGAFADDFHVYAIEWQKDTVRWYVDGQLYKTMIPKYAFGKWVFDHPFFIILNVAVGGGWPGYPDDTTTFPQTMQVDYVRVYQEAP